MSEYMYHFLSHLLYSALDRDLCQLTNSLCIVQLCAMHAGGLIASQHISYAHTL